MELKYRGLKIDTESQRILEALSEKSTRASELASLIGVDDPQQVRYRINRYLQPAGLVTTSDTRVVNGGEATIYSLTEDGEIALEIAPDEFAESHDPAEYREEIQVLHERVETLSERLEKESSRIDDRPTRQTLKRTQERLETSLETIELQAEWASKSAQRAAEAKQDVVEHQSSLDERTKQVEDTVASHRNLIDELRDELSRAQQEREDLAERVQELEAEMEDEGSSWWPF